MSQAFQQPPGWAFEEEPTTQQKIKKDLTAKIAELSEALEKEEETASEYLKQLIDTRKLLVIKKAAVEQERKIVAELMKQNAVLERENKRLSAHIQAGETARVKAIADLKNVRF